MVTTTNDKKIKAMIVDDEPPARRNLRALLKRDPEIELVKECGNGKDAVSSIRALQPDLVFLDVQMPEPGHTICDTRGDGAQSFQIASAILKETRRVYVVLPASYARSAGDRRYPMTLVLDGEANVPPAAAVSHELSRNGQIPESVIVAIPNMDSMRGRLRDLTPPGLSVSGSSRNEGGDRFLDFIEKELLPAVDRQFRGAAPRTFIGHSSGGILVTYAAATRSTYRAVVAIDTPTLLDDDWLVKKLVERAKAAPAPLRYVSLEARFGWTDETWKALMAAAPATWKLYREQFKPKESHKSMVMLSMYLGLRFLLGGLLQTFDPFFVYLREEFRWDHLQAFRQGLLADSEGGEIPQPFTGNHTQGFAQRRNLSPNQADNKNGHHRQGQDSIAQLDRLAILVGLLFQKSSRKCP